MKDWDDIRIVALVARSGSLVAAAKSAGVAHTTLSRRIADLERRKGVRLFERLPDGYVPTDAGRQMADTAWRIETELSALDLALAGKDSALAGPLTITAPALLLHSFLAPHLKRFVARHPEIEINVNAAHRALDLGRREADIAIRATNDPPETLFGRRVARQKRTLYAAPAYLASRQDASDQPHDLLGFNWWSGETPVLPNARVVARFDDMVALLGAVRAGMGVGRLPCMLGDIDDGLVRLPGAALEDYFDFWVLCHPTLKTVPRIRTFMRFVTESFDAHQDLFDGRRPRT